MNRTMVQLGALRAYVVTHHEIDSFDARCVVAQMGEASPWLFSIDGDPPAEVFAIAEDRLIVAGERGGLTLVDVGTQQPLATWNSESSFSARYLLSRDRRYLVRLGRPCGLIDTSTLEIAREFDVSGKADQAAEAEDGRFILLCKNRSELPPGKIREHLAIVPVSGPIISHELPVQMLPGAAPPEGAFRAGFDHLSPCGRWLLRFHNGSISMRGASRTPDAEHAPGLLGRLFGKPSFERALQARAKAARVDVVLELWRTQPLGFERRVVVGEVDIPTLAGVTPDQLALNEDAGSSLIAEGYEALSNASRDREFADWTPDLPPLSSTLNRQAEYRWIWRLSQSIGSIVWSEDGEAIRVSPGTAGVCELRVDGGPVEECRWLEIKPVLIPRELHALALDYIEDAHTLTIDLAGAETGHLSDAINALAQRVRRDFATVFGRERLQIRFSLPDRKVGEPEFFELVVRHTELGPTMGRLWQAFNYGSSDEYQLGTRYDGTTAFFAHAALAYARLDPEAWRLLDLWFRRKPDHDSYGPDHVLPAISETNGWSDREVIEWGLRAMWREELQGSSGAVFPCVAALVDRARLLYSAADFAAAVRAAGLDCAASDPDFADDSVAGIAHLFAPGPEACNLWDLSLLREFKRLGMAAKLPWA